MQAPLTCDDAFLVRREPFDLPQRQEDVGKYVERPTDDPARDPRPAFRAIEVHDVRELVDEREPQPVVEIELRARRPHGVDDDRVVRHRGRVAVREFALVGEHDVGDRRRAHAERTLEPAPCVLGDRGRRRCWNARRRGRGERGRSGAGLQPATGDRCVRERHVRVPRRSALRLA